MHYKIGLGSMSERKLQVIHSVMNKLTISDYAITNFDASSGVPEHPFGEDSKLGSYNRASQTKKQFGSSLYFAIGLEFGYRHNTNGSISALAWCTLIGPRGVTIQEQSQSYQLPKEIEQTVLNSQNMDINLQSFYEKLSDHKIQAILKLYLQKDYLLKQALESCMISYFGYHERFRCVGIVVKEEKLLVLKHTTGDNFIFVLPGGGLEDGETTLEAATREVLEETSISTSPTQTVLTIQDTYSRGKHFYHVLEYVSGEPALAPDAPEMISKDVHSTLEPQWVLLSDIPNLNLKPEVFKSFLIANPDPTKWGSDMILVHD